MQSLPVILTIGLGFLVSGCTFLFENGEDRGRAMGDAGAAIDAIIVDMDAAVETGEIVLGEIITLSGGGEDAIDSVLVWDDSEYRVLWRVGDVLRGRTVGAAESEILTNTASRAPGAAWNGSSLVVTWPDNRAASTGLFCAPFDDGYNTTTETEISAGLTGGFHSLAAIQAVTQVGVVVINQFGTEANLLFVRLDDSGARIAAPRYRGLRCLRALCYF